MMRAAYFANKDPHRYDDIIDLERPVSRRHQPMSREARAAQFAPFAALNGFTATIRKTGQPCMEMPRLSAEVCEKLDRTSQEIIDSLADMPLVSVTYFVKNETEKGGALTYLKARVRTFDYFHQAFVFEDGTVVETSAITQLDIDRRDNDDL